MSISEHSDSILHFSLCCFGSEGGRGFIESVINLGKMSIVSGIVHHTFRVQIMCVIICAAYAVLELMFCTTCDIFNNVERKETDKSALKGIPSFPTTSWTVRIPNPI